MGHKVLKTIVMAYLKKFAEPKIKKLTNQDLTLSIHEMFQNGIKGYTFYIDTEPDVRNNNLVYEIVKDYIFQALRFVSEDVSAATVYLNQRRLNIESVPYQETISENKKIRVFTESVDDGELKWHRDRESRLVEVLESNNWKVQLDNELPVTLEVGKSYLIPEGVFHRVIKGNGDLKVSITFV
jgi:hypothetical protein